MAASGLATFFGCLRSSYIFRLHWPAGWCKRILDRTFGFGSTFQGVLKFSNSPLVLAV
jgi:hypothetical protein